MSRHRSGGPGRARSEAGAVDRRAVVLGGLGAGLGGVAGAVGMVGSAKAQQTGTGGERAMATPGSYHAYVGCRTSRERSARGEGINVYAVDGATAAWTHVQLVDDLVNPSFLAFDRTSRVLYTVHGDSSEISAFRIDPASGTLTFLNQQSTKGRNPVHLTVDPTNRFVVVANHVTTSEYKSSLVVLPLGADGSLEPVSDTVPLQGRLGPHRVEQPFAKPHQVVYDPAERFIVVPDKGLDLVVAYRLTPDGKLQAVDHPAEAREGAGPRHVGFHPRLPYAYVLNELDSTVMATRFDGSTGHMAPFQIVSSLPDTFVGNSRASEIEVSADGRFVYASNRGYDSVAIFAVEPESGRLASVGWQPSEGRTPRFFALDPTGRFMFVANEDSDTIVTYAVDRDSGALKASGQVVRTGSPVCIVFRPAMPA